MHFRQNSASTKRLARQRECISAAIVLSAVASRQLNLQTRNTISIPIITYPIRSLDSMRANKVAYRLKKRYNLTGLDKHSLQNLYLYHWLMAPSAPLPLSFTDIRNVVWGYWTNQTTTMTTFSKATKSHQQPLRLLANCWVESIPKRISLHNCCFTASEEKEVKIIFQMPHQIHSANIESTIYARTPPAMKK